MKKELHGLTKTFSNLTLAQEIEARAEERQREMVERLTGGEDGGAAMHSNVMEVHTQSLFFFWIFVFDFLFF